MRRLLVWQVVIAAAAVACAVPLGWAGIASAAAGAATCLLANWYLAFRVFRRYSAREPGKMLARIYGAEIGKIAIALAGFAMAFAIIGEINPLALFGAYLAVQMLPAVLAPRPDACSKT